VIQTILITLRYGLVARNVLRTGIFRRLKEAGHRIVLVCPAAHEQYLINEVASPQVILEPYPKIRSGKTEQYFTTVANGLLFNHFGVTKTLTIKWLNLIAQRKYISFLIKGLAGLFCLHRSKHLRLLAERLDRERFHHPEVAEIFDKYRPDLMVTTNLFGSECHFLREAWRRGIRSVCLVKSWDNLTSKTRIRVHPDYLVVWGELMKEEAVKLHFYPEERIFVSGAPNFDFFKDRNFSIRPRNEFLKSIGAESDVKLVVYSPANKLTFSDDENIRRIHRILQNTDVGVKCHLHIRKYPKTFQEFSHLLDIPGITAEDSGLVVPSWDDRVDQTYEQMMHLAELMYHADVLIQIGSTIAIDAACFDTPVIGYSLDVNDSRVHWSHYARRVFDFTHNRYLVELGGVRLVHTEEELVNALKEYLHHPERDREGRRRIVERICGRFDGLSGERIATFLLHLLDGKKPEEEQKEVQTLLDLE